MRYDAEVINILGRTNVCTPAQLTEARAVKQAFLEAKPKGYCIACNGRWAILINEEDNDNREWRCGNCGRLPISMEELTKEQRKHVNGIAPVATSLAEANAKLSAAVTKRTDARKALTQLESALNNARIASASAGEYVEADDKALAEAEFDAVEGRVRAAKAGKGAPKVSLTERRTALAEAHANLKSAEDAQQSLVEQVSQAEQSISFADDAVRCAAIAVLGVEKGSTIIARTTKALETFMNALAELRWLYAAGAVPGSSELLALMQPVMVAQEPVDCPELQRQLQTMLE